jgi:hypothetical protein
VGCAGVPARSGAGRRAAVSSGSCEREIPPLFPRVFPIATGKGVLAQVAGSSPIKAASSRIAAADTKRAFREHVDMPCGPKVSEIPWEC